MVKIQQPVDLLIYIGELRVAIPAYTRHLLDHLGQILVAEQQFLRILDPAVVPPSIAACKGYAAVFADEYRLPTVRFAFGEREFELPVCDAGWRGSPPACPHSGASYARRSRRNREG